VSSAKAVVAIAEISATRLASELVFFAFVFFIFCLSVVARCAGLG
jgi:hypothetical protein